MIEIKFGRMEYIAQGLTLNREEECIISPHLNAFKGWINELKILYVCEVKGVLRWSRM